MLRLAFFKADNQPEVSGVCLEIKDTLPIGWASLGEWDAFCDEQAKQMETTLVGVLPGGVYDRLLAAMLTRKMSHLRVSHHLPFEEKPRPTNG